MPNAKHRTPARIALVLGGGGLKGFAHIGVLRALEERGIRPAILAGSSVGAMLGAATATGASVSDLAERARRLRRRDLLRINHVGMLLERMHSPSIYLEEPLRALVHSIVPHVRFDEIPMPLYVNTVDVQLGTQVVWGLPGLRDVFVDDAVYASCALPGFFPPGRVDGRFCIDGGTVDNLPVGLVARESDLIVAVDVGNGELPPDTTVAASGFASISMRAAMVMMHALQGIPLARWEGPPMILIRPKVAQHAWFRFGAATEFIESGYVAATEALRDLETCIGARGRIFPRRRVQIRVDRARCNGCGLCVANAPRTMALDKAGKAVPRSRVAEWSPADGDFVRHCPTGALTAVTAA